MNILITAGPTREPIDQVRYISNRSSGRMGIALAQAAIGAGHRTTLLLGPVCIAPPAGCTVHRFETASDLEKLLAQHFSTCNLLIMAAAVGDYQINSQNEAKIKRQEDRSLVLNLTPTPDLIAKFAAQKTSKQKIVAFALEAAENPQQLQQLALDKLNRKGADAIVANPLETMDAPDIQPMLLKADGSCLKPEQNLLHKAEFAKWLIAQLTCAF